jgi:hypothetical protein
MCRAVDRRRWSLPAWSEAKTLIRRCRSRSAATGRSRAPERASARE